METTGNEITNVRISNLQRSKTEHVVSVRSGHLTIGPYNSLILRAQCAKLVGSWDFVIPIEDSRKFEVASNRDSKAGTLVDADKLVFTIPSRDLIKVITRRQSGGGRDDEPLTMHLDIDAHDKNNDKLTRMRVECKGVVCFAFRQAMNDCILVANTVAEVNSSGYTYDLKFVMFGIFNRHGEKNTTMPIYVIKHDGSLVSTEEFRIGLTQALVNDTTGMEPHEFLDKNLSH